MTRVALTQLNSEVEEEAGAGEQDGASERDRSIGEESCDNEDREAPTDGALEDAIDDRRVDGALDDDPLIAPDDDRASAVAPSLAGGRPSVIELLRNRAEVSPAQPRE